MSELEVKEMQKWLQPPLPHQKQIQKQLQLQQQQYFGEQQQGKANLQARHQSTDL